MVAFPGLFGHFVVGMVTKTARDGTRMTRNEALLDRFEAI
jgi:hypothetical protein